ncbi:hypothetical protein B0H17DRAFT_681977 [Mycena rosella]|uniref:Uncharacterized protein n=1 Tax=Mycena rosella TaxID=1033263 RepID=A0AAD7GC40_MYCRO|nr:hypothetical protein B0H17DRAFT_681977 [Mycena rosella]
MSFFSNASGVNINGGTFYSASQGINIQNNLQLAIQEGESHSLVGVGARAVHGQDASQTAIEDGSFSAAEHEDTLAEGSATSRSFRYDSHPIPNVVGAHNNADMDLST